MKTLAILAIGLSLAAPAFVHAKTAATEVTSVRVAYQDVSLTSSSGAAMLFRHLRSAALEACGASDASLREYQHAVQHSACYATSLNRAVSALNAPLVTALYQEQAPLTFASN